MLLLLLWLLVFRVTVCLIFRFLLALLVPIFRALGFRALFVTWFFVGTCSPMLRLCGELVNTVDLDAAQRFMPAGLVSFGRGLMDSTETY